MLSPLQTYLQNIWAFIIYCNIPTTTHAQHDVPSIRACPISTLVISKMRNACFLIRTHSYQIFQLVTLFSIQDALINKGVQKAQIYYSHIDQIRDLESQNADLHLDLQRCPSLHERLLPPGITDCEGSDTT